METKTFTVPNISCGHCKKRIEKTLNELDGISSVNAEVKTKAVAVEWDEAKLGWDEIKVALDKLGYAPEE